MTGWLFYRRINHEVDVQAENQVGAICHLYSDLCRSKRFPRPHLIPDSGCITKNMHQLRFGLHSVNHHTVRSNDWQELSCLHSHKDDNWNSQLGCRRSCYGSTRCNQQRDVPSSQSTCRRQSWPHAYNLPRCSSEHFRSLSHHRLISSLAISAGL